eukprot:scaffold6243_cov180-Ochromonas_danica.AAC.5
MRKVMITDIEEKASHLEDVLMNMIDDVRQTSSQSKALENQVMMLSKERDVLNLSLGKERKKSQEQEEEILKLQNIIDSLHDQRKHLLANFDKELNSQNQLMKSKYEANRGSLNQGPIFGERDFWSACRNGAITHD